MKTDGLFGIFRLISSYKILFILLVEHYLFYQPNRSGVGGTEVEPCAMDPSYSVALY